MSPQRFSLNECFPHRCSSTDVVFSSVVCDSRQVSSGSVFVAIPGCHVDGHAFIEDAIRQGAVAVVAERFDGCHDIPVVIVPSAVRAFNRLLSFVHGDPQQQLEIAGITGTNGKSTTAWLLRSILQSSGRPVGLLGTIEYHDGCNRHPAGLTTPDANGQLSLMQSMVHNKVSHCVMEISSHALQQDRCSYLQLAAAAITNITHDHLDYHGTVSNYRAAKASIVRCLHPNATLLLHADDAGTQEMQRTQMLSSPVLTFGNRPNADLRCTIVDQSTGWQHLRLSLLRGTIDVSVPLIGEFNAINCLVAAALAEQLGSDPQAIVHGLSDLVPVPGRMEQVNAGQPFRIIVDYAHTPDGLERCLSTLRKLTSGRLICVFGAGGDRDRFKRPLMGEAAGVADHLFVTTDNPRSEPPEEIINDILKGVSNSQRVDVDTDRRQAIQRAIDLAGVDDTVVVAGKGHEQYQVIGDQTEPFDDRQVIRSLMMHQVDSAASQTSKAGVPVS